MSYKYDEQVTIELITPEMARAFLDSQVRNRRLQPRQVEAIERDLKCRVFDFNGESIKIDCDGHMIDGQHRCQAICNTGIAARTVVVRGVRPEAQSTIDIGSKRCYADVMSMNGIPNARLRAATLKFIASWMKYGYTVTNARRRAEFKEIELADEIYGDALPPALAIVGRMARKVSATPSIMAFAYFLWALADEKMTAAFFDRWDSQVGLAKGDPVLALEHRLRNGRFSPMEQLGYICLALRHEFLGNRVAVLRAPKIVGWTSSEVNAILPQPRP